MNKDFKDKVLAEIEIKKELKKSVSEHCDSIKNAINKYIFDNKVLHNSKWDLIMTHYNNMTNPPKFQLQETYENDELLEVIKIVFYSENTLLQLDKNVDLEVHRNDDYSNEIKSLSQFNIDIHFQTLASIPNFVRSNCLIVDLSSSKIRVNALYKELLLIDQMNFLMNLNTKK